ncbi:MAG: hypothetical protein PWQ18_455 [Clostridia bacterium]|nr:hypothetical protein [Clostridia bacterium]
MPDKTLDARLNLAPLELRVALLARAGLTRWETAAALGLKPGTVKSQLERVAAKLGHDWKDKGRIVWPELEEEVRQAVKALQAQGDSPSGSQGGSLEPTSGMEAGLKGNREIAVTSSRQKISLTSVRLALEGALAPAEAAILQLQGLPSRAGGAYLQKARATQWQLLLLGENRVLYTSAAARFWLKPALSALNDNKYIRFFHSDSEDEPYRPWWLPYTTSGRARGTRAAYYKIGDASGGEYARSFLDTWVTAELGEYVERLHARMRQRWHALSFIARSSGRPQPPAPPTGAELLAAAREALGL